MANTGFVRPNPALERGFNNPDVTASMFGTHERMTINGTVGITTMLLFFVVASAAFSWTSGLGVGLAFIGAMVGLVLGLIMSFKPMLASKLAIPYSVAQGFFLGAISRVFEASYPGIVITAAGLTMAILAAMLFLYRTGVIKVTQNFRLAVAAGVMGIMLFYLVGLGASLLGVENFPLINSNSNFGILFSVFVIVLAAATLAVDFDFIENGAEQGLPKQMEWYGAFGLIASLVWLYIEILRLLSKLYSRD